MRGVPPIGSQSGDLLYSVPQSRRTNPATPSPATSQRPPASAVLRVPMSWPASPGSLPDRRMGFRGNFPDQWLD
jgi:hypothetical protein